MEYKHQRNICQIVHKFFRNLKKPNIHKFSKCHATPPPPPTPEKRSVRPQLVLQDMVLPHPLLWHDLLQLLHHHCRRGRSREAGARAILWAAHVVWYLQVHPLTKHDRSDATLEGRGRRDAGDQAEALGPAGVRSNA